MIPSFESEIRGRLAETLSDAFHLAIDAQRIHLPARQADASFRPPQGIDPAEALAAGFGSLWGAPLVEAVRIVSGWLWIDFSPAFYDALVSSANAALPLPAQDGGSHAVNRMLTLARHAGAGCPDLPAARRALLLAAAAQQSSAAYRKAALAAGTLFSSVPPRDRPALTDQSGALGGALARLLYQAL